MTKLISVIIPIYNVQAYLERCIDSVLNQKYRNLEIILVDDGSLDNCPLICDKYAEKDNRIKIIHKQNGGLSDARNKGIELATGEYVTFLDSDDYFLPNFSEACEKIDSSYDVISFGWGKDKLKKLNYPISGCMKFFKLSFLNDKNIRFIKGIYHEDVPFSLEILINTNKILSYEDNFYYYDKSSSTSITREINEDKMFKRFNDIYNSIDYINNKYNNILNEPKFIRFLSRTRFDTIKLARCIPNSTYQEKITLILNRNKKYFKYPSCFLDFGIKVFLIIFGVKNLLRIISKCK